MAVSIPNDVDRTMVSGRPLLGNGIALPGLVFPLFVGKVHPKLVLKMFFGIVDRRDRQVEPP